MTIASTLAAGALLTILLGPWTHAQAQAEPPTSALLRWREQVLIAVDGMPEAQLKALYLRCDRDSREHALGFADGAQCAMASDALLRRFFAGDFDAMLAWWRTHRDVAAVPAAAAGAR